MRQMCEVLEPLPCSLRGYLWSIAALGVQDGMQWWGDEHLTIFPFPRICSGACILLTTQTPY